MDFSTALVTYRQVQPLGIRHPLATVTLGATLNHRTLRRRQATVTVGATLNHRTIHRRQATVTPGATLNHRTIHRRQATVTLDHLTPCPAVTALTIHHTCPLLHHFHYPQFHLHQDIKDHTTSLNLVLIWFRV